MTFLPDFSSPFFWIFMTQMATFALLYIYINRQNKTVLYACVTVSVILVGIVTLFTAIPVSQTKVPTPEATILQVEKYNENKQATKSLGEYFATREQFQNNGTTLSPFKLGFREFANIAVTCPDSLGTPCGGELFIVSKDPIIHSGNQEFYLVFSMMGSDYQYYGPFTDDLQRIVNESNTTKSLERSQ